MTTFPVRVYIAIIAVEPERDKSKVFAIEGRLPNALMDKLGTSKDIATSLLYEYTGITNDWAVVFPFGVVDEVSIDNELAVLYGVFIPGSTRLPKGGDWIFCKELLGDADNPTTKLVQEAIWRHA